MNQKTQRNFLNLILIFVLLQPILDILSRLAILDIIPNISTFLKPLFVFFITFYLLIKYSPFKRRWFSYIIVFVLFMIGHSYLLYQLLMGKELIFHEIRFMINIAYMIALFISLYTLYHWSSDKKEMLRKIKYTAVITFAIYFSLLILAVLTGTSGMTYEYADKYKLGFKGWYDSGQILGHAFSALFPVILYVLLKPTTNKIFRVIFLALSVICVSLLGTKVPYFIVLIVLVIYIILILFFKFFRKRFISSKFNVLIVLLAIIAMLGTYKFTPVAYNTEINRTNAKVELEAYNLDAVAGKKKDVDYDKIMKDNPDANLSYIKKYYKWGQESSAYLQDLFYEQKLHPSNTRGKQFYYSLKKYELSDIQYKFLGLGFLNQDSLMALESDFFMAIFDFGIFGFILFLCIPIWIFFKSLKFIFTNIKAFDLEMCMLFIGLGIFFSISIYAGYTYIYTNFSIFLVLLMIMCLLKMDILSTNGNKKSKKVKFLMLHLNYGGIESSVVNTANALSKDYDIEIVSFYHFKDDLSKCLHKNVKVKYLYEGVPNREAFIDNVKSKKIVSAFKEGITSFFILIKKRRLMVKNIRKTKEGIIVSTRMEFSVLLSKYGNGNVIKVAQEHCYHNENNKYIKKIMYNYFNIDYLCALTQTLFEDYNKFLKYNNHTKVILLPNMLFNIPNRKSKLDKPAFITVSRLDEGKKVDEIIVNFSEIENKDAKLYIVGDGKEYSNLQKLIETLKLEKRVYLLGYLNHKEIEKYMLKSSCFLMASVTEGFPMVLLEAMSYGVPCIAYKTASGTGDIIENGYNGFIIDNRNSEEYVSSMICILEDDQLKSTMGKNAVLTSEKYFKTEILKIWENLLNNKL